MNLDQYTCIAEKLIYSFKAPLSDELVGEVVKVMVETDSTPPDPTRSNMGVYQLRRQQAIYTIRRYLDKEKNRGMIYDVNQLDIPDKKEFINIEVSGFERRMINQASKFFYCTDALNDIEKKCVYMLLDGHVIRDISETLKKSTRFVVNSIQKSAAVYNEVKGSVA